jgi:hypothetical protein
MAPIAEQGHADNLPYSAPRPRFRDKAAALQGRISHFETVGKQLLAIEGEARFV